MKRQGHLIEKIAETDNLYLAWVKSKKGKQAKPDVLMFADNLKENIEKLQYEILTTNVNVGNYHYFKIFDPKERIICAASFSERILHHAIMNICAEIFEKTLIDNTFATRTNKGTYAALEKAKKSAKKHKWFVKLDVRKYFDNIRHNILMQNLEKLFKDPALLALFYKIINTYCVGEGSGVPIGNLTSQYFANYYLSQADHFAQEQLKVKSYLRYMDDILFFENNKQVLLQKTKKFISFVQNKMQLELKQPILARTNFGINFLGYKIYPYTVKLNKRSKKRFITKFKEYEMYLSTEYWTQKQYQEHILPLFAFIQYADTYDLRKKVIQKYGQQS